MWKKFQIWYESYSLLLTSFMNRHPPYQVQKSFLVFIGGTSQTINHNRRTTMDINKLKATAQASTADEVNVTELLQQCSDILDDVKPTEQYKAIKHLITPKATSALKQAVEFEGFMTVNQATWLVINTYNAS